VPLPIPRWFRRAAPVAAVVLLGMVLREIPNLTTAAWGNDFGIYLGLTERMAETGDLFPPYDGWGTSYQYFPALYGLTAGLHALTGAEVAVLLGRVAGVVGGLTILFAYLVGRELFGSRRIALLAALILAIDPIHVYQTSHPAPLVMGHLALGLALWLFLRWRRGGPWLPLLPAVLLLLVSHHLSTYFFILAVAGIAFGSLFARRSPRKAFARDVAFLGGVLTAAFAYWVFIATPVSSHVRSVTGLPTALVLGILLAGLVALHRLAPRLAPLLARLRLPPQLSARRAFLGVLGVGFAAMAANVLLRPFGAASALPLLGLLVLLPPLLLYAVAAAGAATAARDRRWAPLLGVLAVYLGSLAFGFATQNAIILSYRHLEYLSLPVALFAAKVVSRGLLRAREFADTLTRSARLARPRPAGGVFAAGLVALLLANVATGYALTNGAVGPDERIPDVTLDLIDWMAAHIPREGTVAADHRISQVLWARGFTATNDGAVVVFTEAEWYRIVDELRPFEPRVDYVVIDHIMVESGVQSGTDLETPKMTGDTYGKFTLPPWRFVHRVESEDGSRWAELYRIDWEWADRHAWQETYLP